MATSSQTTSTVNVTLVDSTMGETVYKINNPLSEITLAAIREVYKDILGNASNVSIPGSPSNSHLFKARDLPFVFVSKAAKVETTVTTTDV